MSLLIVDTLSPQKDFLVTPPYSPNNNIFLPLVEKMWQLMGHTPIARAGSDQNRFNSILVSMDITWDTVQYNGHSYHKGTSSDHTITTVALPQDVVCRDDCDIAALSLYYVCHPHSTHRGNLKESNLQQYNLWMISDRWNKTINSVQATMDWLSDVSKA